MSRSDKRGGTFYSKKFVNVGILSLPLEGKVSTQLTDEVSVLHFLLNWCYCNSTPHPPHFIRHLLPGEKALFKNLTHYFIGATQKIRQTKKRRKPSLLLCLILLYNRYNQKSSSRRSSSRSLPRTNASSSTTTLIQPRKNLSSVA